MKKTIILLTIVFISQLCFGQKEVVNDSIVKKNLDSLVHVVSDLCRKDLDLAETKANYMLAYADEHNTLRGKGQSYAAFAGVYSFKGKIGESIAYYIKAAKVFESLDNEVMLSIINFNIGIGLLDQNEFEEAREYIQKAHNYYFKIKKYYDLNTSYMTLGYIDIKMNKSFDSIMQNLKKSEELAIEREDTLVLARTLNLQGNVYTKFNKDLPFAISRIKKAIQLTKIKQPENHFILGFSHLFLGETYWKMKDYKRALMHNDSSLFHNAKFNYPKGLKEVYDIRKDIFESKGNYKQSIASYKLFNKLNNSLFNKEQSNRIARMKTKFETDKIKAQKETAETKVKLTQAISDQNRNYFIGSTIIGFLILVMAVFYFSRLKARKKMELIALELKETQKRLVIEKQYRESELKALKSQMNPHFIFNALNSIQEYIVLNKKNLASDYLGKFADLIRTYLDHSDTGNITIQEEVDSLNLYLELEKLRFENQLDYTIIIGENINQQAITIPTMLVQPYVENALKHGLLHKKSDRKLSITFKKITDISLECCIEDNGIGRKKSEEINNKKIKAHKPFALKATGNRLDLLNYKKDNKIGVKTIDIFEEKQPTGTKVVLNIPFKKEY